MTIIYIYWIRLQIRSPASTVRPQDRLNADRVHFNLAYYTVSQKASTFCFSNNSKCLANITVIVVVVVVIIIIVDITMCY